MITLLREQGIGISVGLLITHQMYPSDWRLTLLGLVIMCTSFALWIFHVNEDKRSKSPLHSAPPMTIAMALLVCVGIYMVADHGLIWLVEIWRSY